MRKISPSQSKIIIIAVVFISVFLILLFFVYLPGKNTLTRMKSKLFTIEGELRAIETIFDQAKTMDEGMKLLEERHRELINKFPQKEEEAVKMLSSFARNLNIEIASVRLAPKTVFLDENKQKVEIEGKTCELVPATIEMKCFYKNLVKYIETLKKSLPAFISIERLRINKEKSGMPRLNIVLDLNLYLLS